MRSAIHIYALLVCFAALMCLVVALGIGLYDIVQIAAPRFTLAYYQPYQSNQTYRQYYTDAQQLPDDEVSRRREQALGDALRAERRAAMQSAVFVLFILVIDAIVFAIHWRMAKSEAPAPEH